MKLGIVANQVLLKKSVRIILESVVGDASSVQKKMFALGNELKADGENVTDLEVQGAMLGALIDADGKIDSIDVSDVESIKKDIKESRGYVISESELMHALDGVAVVLGNAALLHAITASLETVGIKVDEASVKQKLQNAVTKMKKVTGWPAKKMEEFFTWIAKKLGFSQFTQKIAGLSGVLVITVAFLALSVYMFPSISSGVLLMFAIGSMVGKSVEIAKVVKEIWHHIKNEAGSSNEPSNTEEI